MALKIDNCSQPVALDRKTVEKLIALKDGDAAALYLSLCAGLSHGLDGARLESAEKKLVGEGLAFESAPAAAPEIGAPDYTKAEMAELCACDISFRHIVAEAEKVFGALLKDSEVKILMTIYSFFGLAPECIFMLLHFVSARAERSKKRATLYTVKKEAMRWIEQGIDTLEKADDFINNENRLNDVALEIEKAAGMPGYSADELRMLRSWAEMGFDGDCVDFAGEVSQKWKGQRELAYMGAVLRNWKKENLTDIGAIKEREAKRKGAKPPAGKGSGPRRLSEEEAESLRRARDFADSSGERGAEA